MLKIEDTKCNTYYYFKTTTIMGVREEYIYLRKRNRWYLWASKTVWDNSIIFGDHEAWGMSPRRHDAYSSVDKGFICTRFFNDKRTTEIKEMSEDEVEQMLVLDII